MVEIYLLWGVPSEELKPMFSSIRIVSEIKDSWRTVRRIFSCAKAGDVCSWIVLDKLLES